MSQPDAMLVSTLALLPPHRRVLPVQGTSYYLDITASGWEYVSGQEFVFGCVRAVFVSERLGFGCVWRVLSPDVSRRCLSPGHVCSMYGRKLISDILFPSSLLFYAESFS